MIPVLALCATITLWGVVRGAQAAISFLAPPDPGVASVVVPKAAPPVKSEYTLKRGDTFASALTALGVPNNGAVVSAAMAVHDVAKVRAGDTMTLIAKADEAGTPLALRYPLSQDRTLWLDMQAEGGPVANIDEVVYDKRATRKPFDVNGTLWQSAIDEGLSAGDVANLVDIFEYDVDFQTELRDGAHFTAIVDGLYDDAGELARYEGLHAVRFVNDGKTYTAIRYVHEDGDVGWYDTEGKQRARPFLRNPLPFLRVTSSMGYRTHPISRKRRYHGGVDLGAPTGTPVRATASGVVEHAGWNGGYGNYIKIGHSTIGPYKTAYAHLHKIKVKKGQRVKQGDVIGTVGSTGRSTGPHLHYELHVRGKKVDPFKAKLPSARTLPSSQKASFNVVRDCWMPWVEGTASEDAPRCVQPHDDKEG